MMFGMKRLSLASIAISTFLGGTLIFSGCGGSGGGKKSSAAVNPYVGNATLTGTVSLSGLSAQDQALLSSSSATTSSSRRISAAGDAVVKLYVLDDAGDLEDTGTSCTIDSTGAYTCPNIADGQEYIVRYVKELAGGKVLEMKSSASVASGATEATSKIDPVTTMVTEAIMDAVLEAITGVVSDQALVKQIMASVKTAVETTVKSLINTGVISVPSLVAEGTIETVTGTKTENSGLSEVSGAVLSDDSISSTLNAAKSTTLGSSLANLTNREKIALIFKQMSGDKGGAPGWVTDFIGDKWSSVTSTMTVQWLTDMVKNSMEIKTDNMLWVLQLSDQDSLPGWVNDMAADINDSVVSGLDDGTALADAKAAITEYHTLKAKTTKTEADLAKLAEFPSIVGELFPASFVSTMTSTTKFQNAGQITAYLIYLIDIYAREASADTIRQYLTDNGVMLYGDMNDNIHLIDFSPEQLFTALDFGSVASNYYGLYFNSWIDIRTDRYWPQGSNQPVNLLRLETDLENPKWFMDESTVLSSSNFTANLTYPTSATATKTVAMKTIVENDGGEYRVRLLVGPDWSSCNGSSGPCTPTSDVNISDHVTGDYVITVSQGGYSATKTIKDVFILSNPDSYKPKLVSPAEYPQWPGENATQAENDAYNTAMQAFMDQGGVTTFAPDEDGNLTNALFKWKAPDLSGLNIPDTVEARYQVGINLFDPEMGQGADEQAKRDYCNQHWDECNVEIYNTWWNNRAIKGTSFMLPVALPENSATGEYNINVNLVFIDKKTGNEMAQGGQTWAQFKVGTADVPNNDSPINLTGSVTVQSGKSIPVWVDATKLKVALVADSCEEDTDGFWTCTSDVVAISSVIDASTVGSDTYEINTTVGAVKTVLAAKKHLNLVLFEDKNSDNQWTPWTPNATDDTAEDSFWMNGKWINFENWGEFRVGIGTQDGDYTSQKVGVGGVTVENLDFLNPFNWEDVTISSAGAGE